MSQAENGRDRKQLLVTLSVAALISDEDSKRLLLVKHCKNGLLGLPAGGLKWLKAEKRLETAHEALKRELQEETGLDPNHLRYHLIGLINLPGETKNRFGIIFDVDFEEPPDYRPGTGADFPYKPTDTEEIESANFFTPVQLLDFMRKDVIYKPDFNRGLIHWWIRNSERTVWDPYRGATSPDEDSDLNEELLRKLDQIQIR